MKLFIWFLLLIVGVAMMLIPSKHFHDEAKDKPFSKRRDITLYEALLVSIGAIFAIAGFTGVVILNFQGTIW